MRSFYSIVMACLLSIGVIGAPSITPYLQTAKPTSIYVNFKTESGTSPTIMFGTDSTNMSNQTIGSTQILESKDSDYNTPYHYHTIKLDNLTPNTGYHYKAYVQGSNDSSAIHYLKPHQLMATMEQNEVYCTW